MPIKVLDVHGTAHSSSVVLPVALPRTQSGWLVVIGRGQTRHLPFPKTVQYHLVIRHIPLVRPHRKARSLTKFFKETFKFCQGHY